MSEVVLIPGPTFQREAKTLRKKFASLAHELRALGEQLRENPQLGTPLGRGCYKIRLTVRSKGGGKSGGMRIITYVVVQLRQEATGATTVYLASIYDKSEQDTISDTRLRALLAEINHAG
ncbi:hypothetical protein [Hymenobacter metallilatus]|uniref:Addiction module toxin RelE n=1 Tax=Hymenobacter metallilatus TaxID=2493666 RepID=A0A428JN03_9BACT|nr:hypothetical protein [Hymenobacter metallilatus]RSK34622.1 hypothetical protein EI290_08335 [Hymenobacter metallilatus]